MLHTSSAGSLWKGSIVLLAHFSCFDSLNPQGWISRLGNNIESPESTYFKASDSKYWSVIGWLSLLFASSLTQSSGSFSPADHGKSGTLGIMTDRYNYYLPARCCNAVLMNASTWKLCQSLFKEKKASVSPNMFVVPNCDPVRIKGIPPLLCDCDPSRILYDGYLFWLISKAEDLQHIRPGTLRMFLATFFGNRSCEVGKREVQSGREQPRTTAAL